MLESASAVVLSQVISLMRIAPAAEDDRAAKATLFTNFVCILPRWLAAREWNEQGVAIVSELLGGIREVTGEADSQRHQNLLRCGLHLDWRGLDFIWSFKPKSIFGQLAAIEQSLEDAPGCWVHMHAPDWIVRKFELKTAQ